MATHESASGCFSPPLPNLPNRSDPTHTHTNLPTQDGRIVVTASNTSPYEPNSSEGMVSMSFNYGA